MQTCRHIACFTLLVIMAALILPVNPISRSTWHEASRHLADTESSDQPLRPSQLEPEHSALDSEKSKGLNVYRPRKRVVKDRAHVRCRTVNVVIVAPSAAAWDDRRTKVREQLGKNMQLLSSNQSAIFKFALGTADLTPHLEISTRAEQATFSDMLFFNCIDKDEALNFEVNWNIHAGPSSTTCKVKASVLWAVKHYQFQYFFRLGDDSYLRIDRFMSLLGQKELPTGKAVIGMISQGNILGTLHDYPEGMGFGLTYEVCEYIVAAAPWLLDTAPEDGVIAKWLFAIGTQFVHSTAWHPMDIGEPCDPDMILGHRLSNEQWASVNSKGIIDC